MHWMDIGGYALVKKEGKMQMSGFSKLGYLYRGTYKKKSAAGKENTAEKKEGEKKVGRSGNPGKNI